MAIAAGLKYLLGPGTRRAYLAVLGQGVKSILPGIISVPGSGVIAGQTQYVFGVPGTYRGRSVRSCVPLYVPTSPEGGLGNVPGPTPDARGGCK